MKRHRPARTRFGCRPAAGTQQHGSREANIDERLQALGTQLPGIGSIGSRMYLAAMLATAEDWVDELQTISTDTSSQSARPGERAWDARREIVRLARAGDKEESTWLAFLCILVGEQNDEDPWRYVGQLYSGLGAGLPLTWKLVNADPSSFARLFAQRPNEARAIRFANHRKFESQLRIPDVVASYVAVVHSHSSQAAWLGGGSETPTQRFTKLLPEIQAIKRFGRLAAYDFLVLLGSLDIYPLEPERLYLDGSTGPLAGARLLFGDAASHPSVLDEQACQVAERIGVSLRAMEDALCNWQKEASSL